MQPEKKQLEILLMHYFRECYPVFPRGKLISSESPDFILKLKTRTQIGIELTRLNPLNAPAPGNSRLEQHIIRDRIIHTVKELVESNSSMQLFVKFLFSENNPIEAERELSVIAQVAHIIRKSILLKKLNKFFYIVIDNKSLPRGLENILIINHPALENSIWERSNNLGLSEDVLGDIREAIYKKDEKLHLYHRQNLNSYWLIVITDRLQGTRNYNLHDKIMNHDFQSHFQHVFLFDLIKTKIFQLV